jgi:(p)ppGpp synthase/HD superfamily hydrolase
MATLEQAIEIAVKAHSGQTDKAGKPYILHPLRVMFSLTTESERIAGVLHDVIEDCQVSIEDLVASGFSKEVIGAIEAVTKRPEEKGSDEGYQEFVARAAANPIARRVKIADLRDNMDVTRLGEIGDKDAQRLGKYLKSLNYLESMEM